LLAKLVHDFGVPYWPAIVVSLVVAACVGAACELLLRRLFTRPRLLVMVATIGLTQVLFLATLLPFVKPKKLYVAYPVPIKGSFRFGHYLFHGDAVLALVVGPAVVVALALFMARSPPCLAMRAM